MIALIVIPSVIVYLVIACILGMAWADAMRTNDRYADTSSAHVFALFWPILAAPVVGYIINVHRGRLLTIREEVERRLREERAKDATRRDSTIARLEAALGLRPGREGKG